MRRVIPTLVITGAVAQFGLGRWAAELPFSAVWIGAFAIAVALVFILEPRELVVGDLPLLPRGSRILYTFFIFVPLFPFGLELLTKEGFSEVGLSYFAYDDYANWLANLSQLEAGEYEYRFGGIFNLFLIIALGLSRITHLIFGFPLTGFGVVVLALTLSVLLLGVLAGVIAVRIHRGLLRAGIRVPEATLISLGVLMTLTWFLRDVQRLGHLTVGLLVLVVVNEVVGLGRRPNAAELFWRMLVVLLATTLWFPLEPLLAAGLVLLAIRFYKGWPRDLPWSKARIIAGTTVLLAALYNSLSLPVRLARDALNSVSSGSNDSTPNYVNSLFSLAGGTVSLSIPFIVVLAAIMAISFVQNGLNDPRNIVSGFGIAYTVFVRLFDYLPDGTVNYGSEKLLWISALTSLILCGLVVSENLLLLAQNKPRNRRNSLLVGLLLPFGLLPSSLGIIRQSVVYSAPSDATRVESQTSRAWLSGGVFARSLPLEALPKVCLTVFDRGGEERVIGSFESYPCTRILGGFGYASEPYAAEESIGRYVISFSLRGAPLSPVVKHGLSNPEWLTEKALLIEPSGEVVREERLLDVMAQQFLSHPLNLEWTKQIQEDITCDLAPVAIDSRRGELTGWATTEVEALVVVDAATSDQQILPLTRSVRDDVASLLGAHERRAGFRSGAVELPQSASIFARLRSGEVRPVGEARECTPSQT